MEIVKKIFILKNIEGVKNTFKYFFKSFLLVICLMYLYNFSFLLVNFNNAKDIPFEVLSKSFFYAGIFNIAITSYYVLGLILFYILYLLLSILSSNKIGSILLYLYNYIISFLIVLLLASDIFYYKTFNFHLNATIFDYLDNKKEIIHTVYHTFNLYLLIFPLVLLIIYVVKMHNYLIKEVTKNYIKFIPALINFVVIIPLIGVLIIGARGGIGKGTLNWGRAYFSKYYFSNQIALNGIFALGKSLDLERKERKKSKDKIKSTLDKKVLYNNIQNLVKTNNDTFISKNNPLLRITDTGNPIKKYNIVVVLMESFMGGTVGSFGGEPDLTPNYNQIAKEGIMFDNFYSNGNRSNRGILTTITGFPSQYGKSILKKEAGQTPFLSLPSILKERGYSTHFMYGGDIEFDNMRGFLRLNGIDHIISKKNFNKKDLTIDWGVPDDKLFNNAVDYLDTLREPFYFETFTLSNHDPFDVPNKFQKYSGNMKRYNGVIFADYAMGEFIRKVKDKKWAKNTIFVFVADHGKNRGVDVELDWKKFWNPLVIYSPGNIIEQKKIIHKLGSQVDLLPTVMGFLGGKYKHASWGRDLLIDKSSNNFAYIVDSERFGIISDKYVYSKGIKIPEVIRKKSNNSLIKDNTLSKKFSHLTDTYLELSLIQEEERSFGDI